METAENNPKKGKALKHIFFTILGMGAIAAGYLGYSAVEENHRLQDQLQEQKMQAETCERSFIAIENDLADLGSKAGIKMPAREMSSTPEERIAKEIVFLDKIVKRNGEMINSLTVILDAKDKDFAKFKKTNTRLEKRLNEYKKKYTELVAESVILKTDLHDANLEAALLQEGVAERDAQINSQIHLLDLKSEEIAAKESKLRTAYYVVGTYKDLYANNVVEKRGGVIGLGKTKALKTDFDRNVFQRIDIYSYTSIPVFGGDVTLLTNHPSDSYELNKGEDGKVRWIKITNPEKFWENSKYLVVEAKHPMYAAKTALAELE